MDTDALDRAVRLHVFAKVAATARMPSTADLATALDRSLADVDEALRRLGASRLLVLAPGTANVWLAPPFCAVPTDFKVRTAERTYWAICIWDALGIPAALGQDATITARCGDCGEELQLAVRDRELVQQEGVIHFGVPAARWWDNIGFA